MSKVSKKKFIRHVRQFSLKMTQNRSFQKEKLDDPLVEKETKNALLVYIYSPVETTCFDAKS